MTISYPFDKPPAQLPRADREWLVISSVVRPDGISHPLSYYKDMRWDYRPHFSLAARADTDKAIDWHKVPPEWVESLKDVVFTFMVFPRPGGGRLRASDMPKRLVTLNAFAKWCSRQGVRSFSEVKAIHITQYIEKLRASKLFDRSLLSHVSLLRRVHVMKDYLGDALSDESARALNYREIGPLWESDANDLRRTELIPLSEATELFEAALTVLAKAPGALELRDTLNRSWESASHSMSRKKWGDNMKRQIVIDAGFADCYEFESLLIDIRTACYIALAITTGCRVHELGEVEVGCVYPESMSGETYWWLKSSTRKVGDRPTRWLAPEMAADVARILEWQSAPLRERVRISLERAHARYDKAVPESMEKAEIAVEILELERNVGRLFLSEGADGDVKSTDTKSHNKQLRAFAARRKVRLASPPHTHRFRRTYALMVVRLNKGPRIDMLTLQRHFKQTKLLTAEGYASLSDADFELLDLIDEETDIFELTLVDHWFNPDTPLAGGYGACIKKYPGRHHQPMFFISRKAFLETVRDGMNIRSTTHSWCLSEGLDCGGQGLFERTLCGDCGNGVIDEEFAPIWRAIYDQNAELLTMADIGPGGRQKAAKALAAAQKVLADLAGI